MEDGNKTKSFSSDFLLSVNQRRKAGEDIVQSVLHEEKAVDVVALVGRQV